MSSVSDRSRTAEAGFTSSLGKWIATVSRTHTSEAVDAAERAVVDTVACLIAGLNDDAVARVAAGTTLLQPQGTPDAAPWAALRHGTAAHALDYDDVLDPAASHVSAVLVPALLALAKDVPASGAALIDAYIVGVQAQLYLAEAVNMAHYTRGWHTTSTLGVPAAAAACARLLGMSADQCVNALSIATSLSGGFKRQFGTQAKPLHAGLAAMNGLLATRIAQAGLMADQAPFEGPAGFRDLMAGSSAAGFAGAFASLHADQPVPAPQIWQKRYPCCASTHRAVDAVTALIAEHGIGVDDIERIDTLVSAAAVSNLTYDRPETVAQARFSMQYCVAAAVCDGDLTLATFTPKALSRTDIQAFLPRVSMQLDPLQPADMPAREKSWATVSLLTRSGTTHCMKVIDPAGYPERPLSEAQLEAKFADCATFSGLTLPDSTYASWRTYRQEADAARLYRELCAAVDRVSHRGTTRRSGLQTTR